ncbi:hypothetical protein MNB_SV-9-413 [hydrothermal vent metagenome]|uniref:Uncharacterized protein n=1 Tax=hydrothermal vent metagenome TaxID=652676 RepID=A0A1W1C962_9ZZZZ
MKKYIFWILGLAFMLFGFSAYVQSVPESKNDRVYTEIKKYSPYYLDKRFGGLTILSKEDKNFKLKPTNMEVFHILDKLEKDWGKVHLKLNSNTLLVLDNNSSNLAIIKLENQDEINFIKKFYGIK